MESVADLDAVGFDTRRGWETMATEMACSAMIGLGRHMVLVSITFSLLIKLPNFRFGTVIETRRDNYNVHTRE